MLISTVLGGDLGHSYLLILDAEDNEGDCEGRCPHFLPFTSHGFANQDGR